MTEPEHLDLIKGKCNCVLRLVHEAEATTDTVHARRLYGKAFRITGDIVKALRDRVEPCDELIALAKNAA